MRKIGLTCILLLMCLGTWALGRQKLSHDLRQVVAQGRRAPSVRNDEAIRAMIRFHSIDGETVMGEYGCKVIAQIGDIYVADIPFGQLSALADDERVERIENHVGGKILMDVTPQWINTPAIYDDLRLSQAYTGQGVMLGIIDDGIEVTHPNFFTSDGSRLRITRFLDQFAVDDEPFGQSVDLGREYATEADIRGKAFSSSSNRVYHGTHCLGIAAGSGYTTPYRGVAYETEITAVDSKVAGDEAYGSANELALMKYVFDYADERHMPCVITYSIGFNPVPGDCQLFEDALAQMTGPGHILVAAAGNESYRETYVSKTKDMPAAGTIIYGDSLATAFLMSRDDFTLKLFSILIDPIDDSWLGDSLVYMPSEGSVEKLLAGKRILIEKADTCYIITCDLPDDDTHLQCLGVVIEGDDCVAQMSADLESTFKNIDPLGPRFVCATNNHNVNLPGCLPSVVTVGAFNTRHHYITLDGDTITSWGGVTPEGTIAMFSSQGPTFDGLIKPDVVMPGVNIHASANSYYEGDYSRMLVATTSFEGRDYPWIAISGTSMATPVMAGVVALWLQANPELSPDDVKHIIRETSHPIGDVVPNNTYGYGLADAYAGLLNILGLPSAIAGLSQHHPSSVTIRPADRGVSLQFDHAPAQPFTVRVYSLSGQLQGEHILRPTAATDYFLPPQGASGIYVVQIISSEPGVTGSELIRVAI